MADRTKISKIVLPVHFLSMGVLELGDTHVSLTILRPESRNITVVLNLEILSRRTGRS